MAYRFDVQAKIVLREWMEGEHDPELRSRVIDWLTELAEDPGHQRACRPKDLAPAGVFFVPARRRDVAVTAIVDDEFGLIDVLDVHTLR